MTSTRPRIVHLIPSLGASSGGPAAVTAALAEAAVAAGAAVDVLTLTSVEADRVRMPFGVDVTEFARRGPARYPKSDELEIWLDRWSGGLAALHVHASFWAPALAAVQRAREQGTPAFFSPHGSLMRPLVRAWQVWKAWWIRKLRAAVGEARPLYQSEHEQELSRWAIGAGVVAPPVWRPEGDAAARAGGSILFLGRLDPIKRLPMLVQALAGAPGVRLVVAGPGPRSGRRELARLAATHGVSDRLELRGVVAGPAKTQLLRAAEAVVLPSRIESFGVAVAEALCAGVPVLVAPEVGARGLVEASGGGVVVDGGADAWAAALRTVSDDRCRWAERAGAAWSWARQLPTREEVGERLLELYRS